MTPQATPSPARTPPAALRRWHRWIMTVAGLLLLYMAVSGLAVAIDDRLDDAQTWAREGGGPGARLADDVLPADRLPDPAGWSAGIARAMASAQDLDVASVELKRVAGVARLQLARADGDRATVRRFDAATGAPASADEDGGPPPSRAPALRNVLKSWHYGLALGLAGQFVGLLAGLSLAALSVTGVVLYFRLWSLRRDAGKPAFFWRGGESPWRRLHRWVAIVASVFVLNIALTGSILAAGELQLMLFIRYHVGVAPYPRPTPMPPVSQGPLPGGVPAMLHTAWTAARGAQPGADIQAIQLVARDGLAKALVFVSSGGRTRVLAFDATDGRPVADSATTGRQVGQGYFADWHQVVKRMHRGDLFGGFAGRTIDIAAGLALLFLVLSSFAMYGELRQRRLAAGRTGWLWR